MFIEKTSDAVKHFRLGTMFYQGEVVDQDLVEARRQFKLGWEAKGFKSGFNYAKMLNDGVGGEQDTDTAYNIFNLVGNDYPDAYYEMYKSHHCTDKKTILYQGQVKGSRKCALELGKLTEKEGNEEEAIGAYEAAAVPPNDEIMSEACERLGLLQKKRGDIVSALNNLIYSAEKGLNESRYHLGLLYLQQGKKWSALPEFRNAKNEGHLRAEFEYFKMGISGYFYYIGADIVHDLKKLRDRCEDDELKDEIAMYLGDYYSEKGNIWEAFEWYSTAKASRKTHQILEDELDSIKESMRIGTGYIFLQQKVNEVMKRCPATGELMDKCHFWNGIFDENLGEYDVAMSHYEAGIGYDGCKFKLARLLLEIEVHETRKSDLKQALFHINQILEESKNSEWFEKSKKLRHVIQEEIDDEMPPLLPPNVINDEDAVVFPINISSYRKIVTDMESEISEEYVEIPTNPTAEFIKKEGVPTEEESLPGYKGVVLERRDEEKRSNFVSTLEKLFDGKEDGAGNIYLMGYMYMLSGDNEKAKEEFKKSARMGHRDSLLKLGEMALEE